MTTHSETLLSIFSNHQGKLSDKWSIYLHEYDRIFSPYRDQPLKLLEIGVSHGGSLEIWSKYFAQAVKLVGCDINRNCARLSYDEPNIAVVVGDANVDETYRRLLEEASDFDLIIDDGSHRSGDVVRSFARYFDHLNDGGLYVVEDLHCSYWEGWQGGLHLTESSMAFFKKLADTINHEHWGTGETRGEFLRSFKIKYRAEFGEEMLTHIHSIEFINSMCIVRKSKPENNILGARLLGGTIPLVDDAALYPPLALVAAPVADLDVLPIDDLSGEHLMIEYKKCKDELRAVHASRSWRWTSPLRGILGKFR
jgi:Methyltransferase domain